MGHRALLARERDDGRYDIYHSQWGADRLRLKHELAGRFDSDTLELSSLSPDSSTYTVLRTLQDRDYEVLYVKPLDALVQPYLVVNLDVTPTDPSSRRPYALAPVTDVDIARRLRHWSRTTRAVLGDTVDADILPESLAETYLRRRLLAHPDVDENATL